MFHGRRPIVCLWLEGMHTDVCKFDAVKRITFASSLCKSAINEQYKLCSIYLDAHMQSMWNDWASDGVLPGLVTSQTKAYKHKQPFTFIPADN